ncbi:hypothetical protein SAMN04488529_101330 [Clostridium gasigenes]|uniref:Uncharacterized protein n=2 Tax=Clostridium gasigenes TaxID=94869 RepID=A0A1H0M5N1_9CLOT|nr:hypothetical protein SAMN04488529_101330 [Clostridium gasigenes]
MLTLISYDERRLAMHSLNIITKENKSEIKLDEFIIENVMSYEVVSSANGLAELTLKLKVGSVKTEI